MTENTAKAVNEGKYIAVSLEELMHPKQADDRDGMEIAKEIAENAGLEIIDG